jgi:FlaA1/EpsC-like NDP-sugar epimerase
MNWFERNKHSFLKIFIDGSIWSSITFIAFYLRLDVEVFKYTDDILAAAFFFVPVKFLLVYLNGHHRISWRYSSITDFLVPSMSVLIFTTLFLIFIFIFQGKLVIPRTVALIDAALATIAFLSLRIVSGLYFRRHKLIKKYTHGKSDDKNIVIAGAGESGMLICSELLRHPEMGMNVIGFLDDDPQKQKTRIKGIPVLGKLNDLASIAATERIDELIIAMPSESGQIIRQITEVAAIAQIPCRTVPGLYDLISGAASVSQLRPVQVEDLLRRKAVKLETTQIEAYLKGKRVLVSGAGGSIGSEIVRQVAKYYPTEIVLLGRGENTIHEMVRESQQNYAYLKVIPRIADVRDSDTLAKIFKEHQPEVVFHAAAHKHVYLMESNPHQAILNNVIGTKILADLCLAHNVSTFVNISTDKAINPTSVMGASKRIAEYVVQNAAQKVKSGQSFVSVRFGNVLGSRGSVVPIFRDQIARGGPVTVTHPEMKRYFMTIPEASQLVLQAGALNKNGSVFVLDMGEPVKIVDMATDLIRLSGLEPDTDIKIKFTGIKPGEKLFEELLTSEEGTVVTTHDKIFIAKKNGCPDYLESYLNELFQIARIGSAAEVRAKIKELVPTYTNGE